MTPWELEVCTSAIETYGVDHQLVVCMEELAELTKEVTKHIRGRDNLPQIAEEIADVEVMLEQLKIMFGLKKAVPEIARAKLVRLQKRITKHRGARQCNTTAK